MTPRLAYFLCGTPRTGSTLLCSLLRSTGIAGRPESYFRQPDEAMWAARWGLRSPDDGDAYVRAAIAAGTTPNGVFGVRGMWGTVAHIVTTLTTTYGVRGDDRQVLASAFGNRLRFIHLRRRDVIAQAVSWARAEQTTYWHPGDKVAAVPRFDFAQIDALVHTIAHHNDAWRAWFQRSRIQAYEVSYEDLAADPVTVTRGVLNHLGLAVPDAHPIVADDRKQADQVNAEWIDRYRAAAATHR